MALILRRVRESWGEVEEGGEWEGGEEEREEGESRGEEEGRKGEEAWREASEEEKREA